MTLKVSSAVEWKDKAAIAAWAGPNGGRVFFNRRGTGGLFDGWSALPDGTDERIETAIAAYPAATHVGISDVSPDGRWMLVTVERTGDGTADGQNDAVPGKGTANDLWLQEAGGTRAWKIRVGSLSLIWPRFSPDGTKIVWSERYYWWITFWGGGWRLHLADLVWTQAGVPQMANVKTRNSDGLIEPYGIIDSAGGPRVLFACDSLLSLGPDALAIATLPLTLLGAPTRLSPKTPVGYWNNYNEFAYPVPGTDRIILARIAGATGGSLEYWTMKADGTDAQRLTHFCVPGDPTYIAPTTIAGGLAFDPTNPLRFAAGIALDYADGYTSRMVELEV